VVESFVTCLVPPGHGTNLPFQVLVDGLMVWGEFSYEENQFWVNFPFMVAVGISFALAILSISCIFCCVLILRAPRNAAKNRGENIATPKLMLTYLPKTAPLNAEVPALEPTQTFVEFTAAQLGIVDTILGGEDNYAKLSVPCTVNESELKKQFRQIAVLAHPDKNKAPRATQAFQELKDAFDCLANPKTRAEYDIECRNRQSAAIFFWDPDTSPVPCRNMDLLQKTCPGCKTPCYFTYVLYSFFMMRRLIVVCHTCGAPFALVVCQFCQWEYVFVYDPLRQGSQVTCTEKCRNQFKLNFPEPSPLQQAHNRFRHSQERHRKNWPT
jgi:hypothetical protein